MYFLFNLFYISKLTYNILLLRLIPILIKKLSQYYLWIKNQFKFSLPTQKTLTLCMSLSCSHIFSLSFSLSFFFSSLCLSFPIFFSLYAFCILFLFPPSLSLLYTIRIVPLFISLCLYVYLSLVLFFFMCMYLCFFLFLNLHNNFL